MEMCPKTEKQINNKKQASNVDHRVSVLFK